jgi:tetratricopeptide (TPR) repeat protein
LAEPQENPLLSHQIGRRPALVGRLLLAVSLLTVVACGGAPLASGSAQAELDRGLQAHQAGDYHTAVTHYRQALAIDPNNKFAYYNLGLIDQINGRLTDADANYRAALNIDPNYVPALFNLAIVEARSDHFDEAVELYRRVIELEPDRAGAYLNMGLALAQLQRIEEAEAALQRAIELDPSLGEPEHT